MPVSDGVRVHRYPLHPLLGRHQRLDGRSLSFIRRHFGRGLKPTLWEPAVPVLDQSDLDAQGIDTSTLIPGAPKVTQLGSCSGQTATEAVSRILPPKAALAAGLDYTSSLSAEEWAIRQYAAATDVDDCPGEWPSTDTGSSGLANAMVLKRRGLIGGYEHALDGEGFADLLQDDGVMIGMPWMQAFFEPDSSGFIDSSPDWMSSGLAGGHEIYGMGLEKIVLDAIGRVDLDKSVGTARNHWTASWGDNGCFRFRLRTLFGTPLRRGVDLIQIKGV